MVAGMDAEAHRALAVSLFNRTWELLETAPRTPMQDDEMVHTAHASRYHWGETGRLPQVAVGEWQCSRVYAVLGRAEPALWHARRSYELCREHSIGDYRLAAAFEALARAELVAGHAAAAREWKRRGLAACNEIANPEDRVPIRADLDSLKFTTQEDNRG